jgi:hypothetical protein
MQKRLGSFRVSASEFKISYNTWIIQFKTGCNGEDLCAMRREMVGLFQQFDLPRDPSVCVDFPMKDKSKNRGDLLFGSFARRIEQIKDKDSPPDIRTIDSLDSFKPEQVELTVSDDALTNYREPDKDYKVIRLRDS